jgi:hypothetical protein
MFNNAMDAILLTGMAGIIWALKGLEGRIKDLEAVLRESQDHTE